MMLLNYNISRLLFYTIITDTDSIVGPCIDLIFKKSKDIVKQCYRMMPQFLSCHVVYTAIKSPEETINHATEINDGVFQDMEFYPSFTQSNTLATFGGGGGGGGGHTAPPCPASHTPVYNQCTWYVGNCSEIHLACCRSYIEWKC